MSNYPLFDFPLYTVALASKMVDVVKYEKLDILHVHYAIPHATSAFLAQQILGDSGIPFTTTLHGTDITLVGLEPSYLYAVKFSIEKSNGVTAVSRHLKEKTLSNYAITKDIEVIPNFVDTKKYKKSEASNFRKQISPNNEKILVHVSNFRKVKRVPDTVRIFNEVRKEIPSRLVLVGDGPDRSNTEQLCRDLGICNDVIFLGKQSELVEIYSASDIFLMPSQSESFGLSALEAMACSLPVISSSVGGLPELQVHGETGFIAEIGDIDRMARYTVDLLRDDNKYRIFSEAARRRAVENFEMDTIVPLYEKHYEQIMEPVT